ncbi:DUF4179 domain-containing protein [Psychrobacillus sp. NEAU-3TGS]|uniref:DUF4179 domain-containing protein n=1 Tax=Psychrobacillus sp. NEAU-3TGS TaxID=2995412 RepID=UPI002496C9FB|nr:DUF4179 domain-containing protein [Psychrobacillus sp. NEAU-3TGS]MDI2586692.1 DUF4179 domain-containing protein [Psychrobacillus sp. NEAU-3TGS]
MNCPKADKLSQYVDNLLTEQEHIQIKQHLETCDSCTSIVQLFKVEDQFLKDSLQSPTLSDDFASIVLDQLEPYREKKARRNSQLVKRILILAAGILLALSLTATISPSFAQFIGGLFSTKQVDEGLQMASDEGLEKRLDLEVSDQGLTFKVEDIIIDSSRVALSIQVINENGIAERPNISDNGNIISVTGYNGSYNYSMGYRMDNGLDYNSLQVFINDEPGLEKVTIKFHLVELNGKQGNWELEIPVEVADKEKETRKVLLNNAAQNIDGVEVILKEIQYAPTSNTLLYETAYQTSELVEAEEKLKYLKEEFGYNVSELLNFGTSIKYYIENEEKKVILKFSPFTNKEPNDDKLIISSAKGKGKLGHAAWKESFVPEKVDSKLTFVLEGVYKVVPTDFSVKFNPAKIEDNPVSFEYMGNTVTIKKAKLQNAVSADDSAFFEIEMEVSQESNAAVLGNWVLKGDTERAYRIDNETTEKGNGNFRRTIYFKTNGLAKVSDEMSLHLLTATSFFELEEKWRIPLYE